MNAPALHMQAGLRFGVAGMIFVVMAILAWCALFPVQGAVIASGIAKPEFNSRPIQHREGGTVQHLLVRDGDVVKAGQILLELKNEEVAAGAEVTAIQRATTGLRRQRLEAELRGDTAWVARPEPTATSGIPLVLEKVLRAEADTFRLGLEAHLKQRRFLGEQIAETEREVAALEGKVGADVEGLAAAEETLSSNANLERAGFISKTALQTLSRQKHDYRSKLESSRADLAQARQRVGDLRRALGMLDVERSRKAATELAQVQATLEDLVKRGAAGASMAERLTIRSPVDGTVIGLKVASTGAVIAANQTVMSIVPSEEPLVVDVSVAPEMLPYISFRQKVEMRPVIYGATIPDRIDGMVGTISPDRLIDERTGQSYFSVRVYSIKSRPAGLVAGGSFEVFLLTGERSTYEYLFKPVLESIRRTMREP